MKISKLERLKNKAYRDAYVQSHIDQGLAFQIKALRNQRNMTQEQLAAKLGLSSQSAIVRYEDPSYGKLSIAKIKQLGAAFDVGILIKFVPFSRFLNETEYLSDAALRAKSFDQELSVLEEDCNSTSAYSLVEWQNNFAETAGNFSIYGNSGAEKDRIEFTKIDNLNDQENYDYI